MQAICRCQRDGRTAQVLIPPCSVRHGQRAPQPYKGCPAERRPSSGWQLAELFRLPHRWTDAFGRCITGWHGSTCCTCSDQAEHHRLPGPRSAYARAGCRPRSSARSPRGDRPAMGDPGARPYSCAFGRVQRCQPLSGGSSDVDVVGDPGAPEVVVSGLAAEGEGPGAVLSGGCHTDEVAVPVDVRNRCQSSTSAYSAMRTHWPGKSKGGVRRSGSPVTVAETCPSGSP